MNSIPNDLLGRDPDELAAALIVAYDNQIDAHQAAIDDLRGRRDAIVAALELPAAAAERPAPAEPATAPEPVRTEAPRASRPRPTRTAKAPHTARPRVGTPDYPAIAAWVNAAKADGTYTQQAMARHFGQQVTTVKNWLTRCRQLGLLTVDGPATTEPITKAPFDPQKARDAAALVAAPDTGERHDSTGFAPIKQTVPPGPELKVTVDQARAALDDLGGAA